MWELDVSPGLAPLHDTVTTGGGALPQAPGSWGLEQRPSSYSCLLACVRALAAPIRT